ncbi:MAG TPA: flagellar assembly protein FliW [Clostridia bacterium]
MQVATKHFGTIEIDDKNIIAFPEGLPGFESDRKFAIVENNGEGHPFKWLQSIVNPNTAFVIVNPFDIIHDYDIEISDETVKKLEIENIGDIVILSIVVIPQEVSKMSINLKAPVIINTKNGKGMQVILDTDKYCVRHYILEELHGQEVKNSAGLNKEKR